MKCYWSLLWLCYILMVIIDLYRERNEISTWFHLLICLHVQIQHKCKTYNFIISHLLSETTYFHWLLLVLKVNFKTYLVLRENRKNREKNIFKINGKNTLRKMSRMIRDMKNKIIFWLISKSFFYNINHSFSCISSNIYSFSWQLFCSLKHFLPWKH